MEILPMDLDILPPTDDRIFKLILTDPRSKPALIDLTSAIIKRPVVNVTVRNNELPIGNEDDKNERLDVNCTLDDDTQIDIEMQASRIQEDDDDTGGHRNLKGKSIYYLCDLHSSQPSKGKRYDKLAQTWQVTICAYTVFPDEKDYVNSFSLRHDEDGRLLSDIIRVVFVELTKLNEVLKKAVNDMTDLEKWALFLKYANKPKHREKVNEIINSKEALKMAGTLLMEVSQDERERAIFRSRRMFQSDWDSDMATAYDNGMAKGITEGIVKVARNLKTAGFSLNDIAQNTGLTLEQVRAL